MVCSDLEKSGSPVLKNAREIHTALLRALGSARSLARGLSPINLAGDSFAAAIREMAALATSLYRVPCSCEIAEDFRAPEGVAATHLYRIAQEAVWNAAKHSGGSKIIVKLHDGIASRISVEDDGCGLPATAPDTSSGLGLNIMRYRAGMIGAELKFQQRAGGGTVVCCDVPVV
jgi:signal transduction histidine kinase